MMKWKIRQPLISRNVVYLKFNRMKIRIKDSDTKIEQGWRRDFFDEFDVGRKQQS